MWFEVLENDESYRQFLLKVGLKPWILFDFKFAWIHAKSDIFQVIFNSYEYLHREVQWRINLFFINWVVAPCSTRLSIQDIQ